MFVGVFLMCCSVGWFCVFSTLIQFFDLYPSDVILVRASIQASILGAILVWQGHPLTVTKESVRLAFLASFANLLFPTVIHLLPLGTGTILSHSAVGFTALFAWILLKEPVTGMKGVCIVAIFLGQLMVVQPPFLFGRYVPSQVLGIDQYMGIFMGVLSGAAFGLLLVLGSMTGVPTEHYVFFASFPGIFFGFLVGLMSSKSQILSVGVEELMVVLPKVTACGAFGVLGFVFLVASMGKCPSVLQSLLSSTECVVSFLVQVLLFKQEMNYVNVLGATIVLIALTTATMIDHYRLKKPKGYSKLMKEDINVIHELEIMN